MIARIAVSGRYLADRSASDVVAVARRLGADGVEFAHTHLARAIESPDDAATNLAGLCAEAGLSRLGATLPDLAAVRGGALPSVVSSLCEQIGAASRIGVPAVNLAAGRGETLSMETLVRSVQRLAAMAEASHVRIEVTNRLASRLEQIEDLRRFVVALRHPGKKGCQDGFLSVSKIILTPFSFRLRIDTGECYAAAVNPRDVLAEFADVTGSIVLSDRRGRQDVPLGEGQVNLAGVVGDLARGGYKGWLVVNVRGDEVTGRQNPVDYVRELIVSGDV